MRDISTAVLGERSTTRVISSRMTIRDTRLIFSERVNLDSLGLSDPSTLDACEHGTGILRVVNYGDVLYTQVVSDVTETDPWSTWDDSGISLAPGSRPGVEGSRVWYQTYDGDIYYADYGTDLGTGVFVTSAFDAWSVTIAPVTTGVAYVHFLGDDWGRIIQLESNGDYEEWEGRVYGNITTSRFFDAVRLDGIDHVYFADDDNGRLMTMYVNTGVWSDPTYVVPLDVVDDTSFFRLGYATVINDQVWLTGRLSRATEHNIPVAFDVYMIGPYNYTMGRDLYIQHDEACGKMFLISEKMHYIAANSVADADASIVCGVDTTSKKTQITKYSGFGFGSNPNNADRLTIAMDPGVDPSQLRVGSKIEVEAAYGGEYFVLGSFGVDIITPHQSNTGREKTIAARGWATKRLYDWRADQSYDYWSQAKQSSDPAEMTELVRITGKWSGDPLELEELNLDGIMYAIAKPSRGGLARGKFLWPAGDWNPLFGTGICYYRESRAEAAERLGIETKDVTEEDHGSNGFFALWGATEYSGAPGVGLYVMTDSVGTQLDSAALSIPADTWYWIQIEFHEGLLRVLARQDGTEDWVELIEYIYDDADRLPWARETFGRGAIFVNNRTIASETPGFSHTSTVIPVEDNSDFPTTEVVIVNDEQISYDGKSGNYSLPDMTVVDGYTHYWAEHQNTDWGSYKQLLRAQLNVDSTPIAPLYGEVPIGNQIANNGAYPYVGKGMGGPWGKTRIDEVHVYMKKVGTPPYACWLHMVNDSWDWTSRGESGLISLWNGAHMSRATIPSSSFGTDFAWMEFDLTTLTAEEDRWTDPNYKSGYWFVITLNGNEPITDLDYAIDASNYYVLRVDESLDDTTGCTRYLHYGHGGDADWHFNFFRGDSSQYPDAEVPYKLYGIANTGPGYEIYLDGVQDQCLPEDYKDMALVVIDGPGKGSVFHVLAFDYQAPDQWVPNRVYAMPDRWEMHINESGHGEWVTPDMSRVFVEENPASIIGPGSVVRLYPTLIVDERGYNGTTAASHGPATVSLYRDLAVQLDRAEFYSLERDFTIEDMARELAAKAGVDSFIPKRALEGVVSLTGGEPEWLEDRMNFIADFEVPSMSSGDAVGVVFRSDTDPTLVDDVTQGYQVVLADGDIELRRFDTSWAAVERYGVPFTPVGNMRVSVHDNSFSVWIGGRFVHTFVDSTYEDGLYAGMISDNDLAVTCDWQDVDIYKDNFIFDIGNSAASLLGQMIGPRRVWFGDEQYGGLRLFRTRDEIPDPIDLAVDVGYSLEDFDQATRIRAEGANFAEAVDYDRLRTEGNLFQLMNASEANNAWDAYREAELTLSESASNASRTMPSLALDPRVQCQDQITVSLPGGDVDMIVESITITMSMENGEPALDMEIDARAA